MLQGKKYVILKPLKIEIISSIILIILKSKFVHIDNDNGKHDFIYYKLSIYEIMLFRGPGNAFIIKYFVGKAKYFMYFP